MKSDNKVQLTFTHNKVYPPIHMCVRECKKLLCKNERAKYSCTCKQLSFPILMYFCFFWLSNVILIFLTPQWGWFENGEWTSLKLVICNKFFWINSFSVFFNINIYIYNYWEQHQLLWIGLLIKYILIIIYIYGRSSLESMLKMWEGGTATEHNFRSSAKACYIV